MVSVQVHADVRATVGPSGRTLVRRLPVLPPLANVDCTVCPSLLSHSRRGNRPSGSIVLTA